MLRKLAGFVAAAGMVVTVACGQTDAGITTNVKTKLAADDVVKAYQVAVDTENRVVTLGGDVETAMEKDRAITIARETDGVRDVIDRSPSARRPPRRASTATSRSTSIRRTST